MAGWRRQQGRDIGDPSAHGTGYSSGSSAFAGFWHAAFFLAACSLSCFPTHPVHIPSRIDRGEFPGVAVPAPPSSTGMLAGRRHWALRLRLCLAPPGCLLGSATWRPACCNAGIPANYIESIDQIRGVLGAVH